VVGFRAGTPGSNEDEGIMLVAITFWSLFIFLIIFKTWQNFTEKLQGQVKRENILTRAFVAGSNAGILAVLLTHIKEIQDSGLDNQILSYLLVNGLFWAGVGFGYGWYYRKKKCAPAPVLNENEGETNLK